MDTKKLIVVINRLIKLEVDRQVENQVKLIRAEIISEVAGMLSYSERKMLMEMSKNSESGGAKKESDFDRSMKNLKSMPGYKGVVDRIDTTGKSKRQYTSNPTLNELLNNTDELDESPSMQSILDSFGADDDDVNISEPWTNEGKIQPTQRASENKQTQKTLLGTDNRPVNMTDERVQNVMNILNNTNFKEKYENMKAAGDQFRDMGAPAPRFTSEYFDETTVG